ncbi:hypothetical protein K1X76_11840 [bacterium]|nr:hypothetical protein [bacterium]
MTTKHWIALVLNAFVIPGAGQYYLKRKKLGTLIMAAVCFIVLFLIVHFEVALYHNIKMYGDPTEALHHAKELAQGPLATNKNLYQGGSLVLALLWVYGIVEIFLSRKTG